MRDSKALRCFYAVILCNRVSGPHRRLPLMDYDVTLILSKWVPSFNDSNNRTCLEWPKNIIIDH